MEILEAIEKHQASFGLEIGPESAAALERYYLVLQEHNELLHLVAPMSAEEFAIRHILESLTLLEHLPITAKFADVGAGAGLPSIPCLLVRGDLKAVLIESKEKKAKFLETAIESLGLLNRVKIINSQFEEADLGDCKYVTCRALDKYTQKLPKLVKWSKQRHLLLFGGKSLGLALQENHIECVQYLMPLSEQRYLYVSL